MERKTGGDWSSRSDGRGEELITWGGGKIMKEFGESQKYEVRVQRKESCVSGRSMPRSDIRIQTTDTLSPRLLHRSTA